MAGAFKDRLFETTEELSMKRTVRSKTSSPTITSSMANVSVPDTASEQTVDQPADQAADETVEQAVEENIADENNNDNEKVLDEVWPDITPSWPSVLQFDPSWPQMTLFDHICTKLYIPNLIFICWNRFRNLRNHFCSSISLNIQLI